MGDKERTEDMEVVGDIDEVIEAMGDDLFIDSGGCYDLDLEMDPVIDTEGRYDPLELDLDMSPDVLGSNVYEHHPSYPKQ